MLFFFSDPPLTGLLSLPASGIKRNTSSSEACGEGSIDLGLQLIHHRFQRICAEPDLDYVGNRSTRGMHFKCNLIRAIVRNYRLNAMTLSTLGVAQ